MKAIRIDKTGGPEVLQFQEIDLPAPAEGEVRMRHSAIGVNFIDTYQRSGLYPLPKLPSGLGNEASGHIEALGHAVQGFRVGDRVAYCSGVTGSYSEAANVPAARLIKIPEGISDEIAAASLLKGMTAQYLLKRTYRVKAGDFVLVHAAAGGVGSILCQWAKHLGAVVVGTVGSEDKFALAKRNGCTHVLNSKGDGVAKRVRELAGGAGVAVVYDSIGKDTYMASLDSLVVRGMLVAFGNASGPIPPIDPLLLSQKGSLYLTRPTLAHYTRTREELQTTADDLFSVIKSGAVRIEIGQRFALRDARSAHEALHGRGTTGSTILIP